jgi:hypothetical protein
LIGDARNDEHLIICQLHLLFIQFHNKVVDYVLSKSPRLTGGDLLEEARRVVRWHYQWIVVHDFLERLVGEELARRVLQPGADGEPPTVCLQFFHSRGDPFMPVEFSGAVFRCGHSMVRDDYRLKRTDVHGVPILPNPHRPQADLGGLRRLPAGMKLEWDRFFETGDVAPQLSLRIDPSVSMALFALPGGRVLPHLNLQRGQALGLPAGPAVARATGVEPLTEDDLFPPNVQSSDIVSPQAKAALLRETPLWHYILCEARTSTWARAVSTSGRSAAGSSPRCSSGCCTPIRAPICTTGRRGRPSCLLARRASSRCPTSSPSRSARADGHLGARAAGRLERRRRARQQ